MSTAHAKGVDLAAKKKARFARALVLYRIGSPGRARTADPVINSHLLYRLSYRGKDISSLTLFCFIRKNGAPGEIRTPDHLVRSQVLYPAELRAH